MIQWTGDNLAQVLAYTGHKDVVINSFGDPCVLDRGTDLFVVCDVNEWIHRFPDGTLAVFVFKQDGRL